MSFRFSVTWKGIALLIVVVSLFSLTLVLRNIYDSQLHRVLAEYGLLGAFGIGLFTNASIIMPLTGVVVVPIVLDIAAQHNDILVIILSALGGAIGESTAYVVGFSGKNISRLKNSRLHRWISKRARGKRVFVYLVVLAAIPSPYDVISIAIGSVRYPYLKHLLATFLGRSVKYGAIVLFGTKLCEIVGEVPIVRLVC